ncbi:MAG: hypothetical protein GX367_04665 [Bacteroidales bacterium]|nr:hypothetical protein [Bacteroidales bacterium]
MLEDKVNIGLTLESTRIAEKLEETGNFEDKLTIAKFALAYAIKNNLDTNLTEDKIGDIGGTKWNIGSVDTDQYLRNVIISLYPEVKTPYRAIEILMNKGLTSIGEIIDNEGIGKISDYM